jgi:hypothetical protein
MTYINDIPSGGAKLLNLYALLDKDINLKKQINDINLNGLSMSPDLIKAVEKLISKFGGK